MDTKSDTTASMASTPRKIFTSRSKARRIAGWTNSVLLSPCNKMTNCPSIIAVGFAGEGGLITKARDQAQHRRSDECLLQAARDGKVGRGIALAANGRWSWLTDPQRDRKSVV